MPQSEDCHIPETSVVALPLTEESQAVLDDWFLAYFSSLQPEKANAETSKTRTGRNFITGSRLKEKSEWSQEAILGEFSDKKRKGFSACAEPESVR